ncbi:membrane-associated, eicosanoid/glutathione metabolism protein [Biscogniauxia marginata]|nr:membrane-associated, eicosanoid/glutathione metabolism protein [Biscogniauxia marginata]
MTTHVGLSTPVLAPLLPITGTFVLPFTAYFALLSYRVVNHRLQDQFYLGDNSSSAEEATKAAQQKNRNSNKLFLATRCHQNFVENVPLGLALAAIAELNGGDRRSLAAALGALFAFRILHAEFGIRRKNGMGLGRPVGYWGTIATMGGLAGYAAYLVKGYWGL